MTRFYTRRGDSGKSVLGHKTLSKDDPVFEALGSLDELDSWLGVCISDDHIIGGRRKKPGREIDRILRNIQETLFIAQAEIATVAVGGELKIKVATAKTEELESIIAGIDSQVPEIIKFVIPGGSRLSASLDFARTLARRAERGIRKYGKSKKLRPELLQYINRLSSVLFALARYVNHRLKIKEENPSYM